MRGALPLLFLLVACGAAFVASKRALERPSGPGGVDALALVAGLERERSVRLDGWSDPAAQRLASAWSARGLTAGPGGALRVVRLEPTDPRARGLLASAGLRPEAGADAGNAWRVDGGAVLDLREDTVVVTRDDPERTGIPMTVVIGTGATDTLADAVESLVRSLPPAVPRLVAYRAGAPRLSFDLQPNGFRGSGPTRVGPARVEVEHVDAERSAQIALAVREEVGRLGLAPLLPDGFAEDLEVRLVGSVDERARTGRVDGAAWALQDGLRLVGIHGVAGVERDLMRVGRDALLRAALGPPAEEWIAEGIAGGIAGGGTGGGSRDGDASRWSGVTFAEAIGASPRTRAARAPAAARLVELALEGAPDRVAAIHSLWRDGLDDVARSALRRRWDDALLEAAQSGAQNGGAVAARRSLPRAVAVRLAD
ncbi:MAG: hypothetical protein AAGB93_25920, partial [Planctomycetota bacterium]